jgi:7-cyano-7-deazaguanine synthase
MTSRRAIVLASGGIDSTACLFYYKEIGHDVEAIFVDYGHPANLVEYEHLESLCKRYSIPLSSLKISGIDIGSQWEIRGRNAFFILAALMARPTFTGLLSLGIHGGSSYYDCGQKFIKLMNNLVSDYTQGTVQLDFPLMEMDKAGIVQYCKSRKVPLELTYSCQTGNLPPCGKCPSCKDRLAVGLSQ